MRAKIDRATFAAARRYVEAMTPLQLRIVATAAIMNAAYGTMEPLKFLLEDEIGVDFAEIKGGGPCKP